MLFFAFSSMSVRTNTATWRLYYTNRRPPSSRSYCSNKRDALVVAAAQATPISPLRPSPSRNSHHRHYHKPQLGTAAPAKTRDPAGRNNHRDSNDQTSGNRAVRFDLVCKMILVPSRNDLSQLRTHLWWQKEDYVEFRCVYVSKLLW